MGGRRASYANVVSTIALFFALGGGALAATHYLITSTKQIKPSVLQALRGRSGRPGPAGTPGANGTNGTNGASATNGAPGATGPTGPAGPGFVRTIVVSPVGSASENGTALLDAMSSISASASAPALLLVEPGVYDLGTTTLDGKSYVDIEGSGEDVTTIESEVTAGGAAIAQPADSEIRSLTIDQDSGTPGGVDMTGAPATLRDVAVNVTASQATIGFAGVGATASGTATFIGDTITATGSGNGESGYGIFADTGAAVIDDTSVTVTLAGTGAGPAADLVGDQFTATRLTASASAPDNAYTIDNEGSGAVQESTLAPGELDVFSGTLHVATSEVDGVAAGTPTCVDDFNTSFAAVSTTCS
jgi:hypothetical protein